MDSDFIEFLLYIIFLCCLFACFMFHISVLYLVILFILAPFVFQCTYISYFVRLFPPTSNIFCTARLCNWKLFGDFVLLASKNGMSKIVKMLSLMFSEVIWGLFRKFCVTMTRFWEYFGMIYGVKDQGTGSLIGKDLHGVHLESYTTCIKTIKCWPNLVGKKKLVFWLSVSVLRGGGT